MTANFIPGSFDANYVQTDVFRGTEVDTSWKSSRFIGIYELEMGAGYVSPGGCFRASCGYLISTWDNVVKTDEFIEGVQTNDFVDLDGRIGFDGFVGRVEGRF